MKSRSRRLSDYFIATLVVALSTAVSYAAEPYSELGDLAVVHLFAIVLLSSKFSLRVSVFACVLSILLLDFIYIPPRFEFAWPDAKGGLTFIAMMVVACVISGLTERLRRQEQAARAAAVRTEALFQLHVDLSTANDARQLAAITARHLERLLSARVIILLGTPDTWLDSAISALDSKLAATAWVRRELTKVDSAQNSTTWAPLVGPNAELGVIGVFFARNAVSDPAREFLLTACANQLASAMERMLLAHTVHRTELEAEAERLRNSLLSAVSHDLRTPLTSIIAAGTTLLSSQGLPTEVQCGLVAAMVGEGERLHRLINNLLSVARLDAPTVELRRAPESIEDIVSASTTRFRALRTQPRITVEFGPNLPFVSAEPLLIEQVLVNLIENAQRYCAADVKIAIRVKATDQGVAVQVMDDGPGIPEEESEKVFEKFFRGSRAGKGDGGVGLGLTTCRAIVRAHGGRIAIRSRAERGTLVEFTLPAAESAEAPREDRMAS